MQMHILLGILFELMHKDKITARFLSELFEISMSTTYRYINSLSLSGVPIITIVGRNGGTSLLHRSFFHKFFFTYSELDTLLNLVNNLPHTPQNTTLIAKLLALQSDKK